MNERLLEARWSPDPPTEPGWYWAWAPGYAEPIREYWTAAALEAARRRPRPGRHWMPSPIPEPPAWPPATADEDTADYVVPQSQEMIDA